MVAILRVVEVDWLGKKAAPRGGRQKVGFRAKQNRSRPPYLSLSTSGHALTPYRPDSKSERTIVVETLAALHSNIAFPFTFATSTHKYIIIHHPIPPQAVKGIWAESRECYSRRRGISECGQE